MVQFALRRLIGAALSLWVVVTLVFFSIHWLPGDPVEAALSQSTAPPEILELRRVALGLDRPVWQQYLAYMGGLLIGQWGISWVSGQPVVQLVIEQLPPTLSLAVGGLVVALTLGFLCGAGSATSTWQPLRWVCQALIGLSISTPIMLSGMVLIWLFALRLDWLPATGQGDLSSLFLPSLCVGFSASGGIARSVEAGLSSVLREYYVLAAQAKGLSFNQAVMRHALYPALLPVLSVIAVQFGYLSAGAVVAEGVFARQGLGRLLLNAVLYQDLPVIQSVVVVTAVSYIALNLAADILHAILDPRIRPT